MVEESFLHLQKKVQVIIQLKRLPVDLVLIGPLSIFWKQFQLYNPTK